MISNQHTFGQPLKEISSLIFQREIKKKFPKRGISPIYFTNQLIKGNILELEIKTLNQNHTQPINA